MSETIEINEGEVKIVFNKAKAGKISFAELGLKDEDLQLENGLLRMVFNLDNIGEHHYYQVPTIEIAYKEEVGETHWQCDFNGETLLDKMDHHGHSTVVLLNRSKMDNLEHRHENSMVLHAEFPQKVHLDVANSYINLFA